MTRYHIHFKDRNGDCHNYLGQVGDDMSEVRDALQSYIRSEGGHVGITFISTSDNKEQVYVSFGSGIMWGEHDFREPLTPGSQSSWWEIVTPTDGETEDNQNKNGLYTRLGLWERFHGVPVFRDTVTRYRGMRAEWGQTFEEVDPEFLEQVIRICPDAVTAF